MASTDFRTNGTHASFQDLRFDLTSNGATFGIVKGLQELNWKRSIERGEERSNGSPFVEDVTTGEVSNEGNAVFLREAWDTLLDKFTAAGLGIFDVRGSLTVTYKKKDNKLVTVVITDVMFKTEDSQNKQGTEGLKVNIDLQIVGRIYVNGQGVFANDKLKS
jgi:hypothetical protein